MLEFKCPHCQKDYSVKEDQAGKMFECAACGNIFHTPSPQACPECQQLLEPGVVVCIKCGFNLQTKQKMETVIHIDDPTPIWLKFLRFMYDLMPGLFRPLIIFSFLACIALAIFLMFMGLMVISMGVFLSGIFICAGALMVYAQGVAFLLAGEFQILKSALVDFTERQTWVFVLLVFGPCGLLLSAMFIIGKHINKL
ncbi:MAG TPA: hypothetical protein DCZ94_00825 [Lentisphaeria bacterium]|nr:MAG: hypothetical protein A2X48_11945 [Lentisphaerae bacterium GWF2_49_21]HBC85474.1 hypothetical protein [Lentisphaeria bacterium]